MAPGGPVRHGITARSRGLWECLCGTAGGVGQPAAERHLIDAGKAAFRALDDNEAYAVLLASANRDGENHAVNLVWHNGRLRRRLRRLHPYVATSYDASGNLTATMRWHEMGKTLAANGFRDIPAGDRLVLQVALSLVGQARISLRELADLDGIGSQTERDRVQTVVKLYMQTNGWTWDQR